MYLCARLLFSVIGAVAMGLIAYAVSPPACGSLRALHADLTPHQALAIAALTVPGRVVSLRYGSDKNDRLYVIRIVSATHGFDIKVNAENGAFVSTLAD